MAKQALAALVIITTLLLACFPREARCEESSDVRASLVGFLVELAGGDAQTARDLRWDATVQPCDPTAPWTGVTCGGNAGRVRAIVLENQGPGKLTGTLNTTLLCAASTLRVLSLQGNAVGGGLVEGVAACRALTHLYLAGNRLSGALPPALARLRDLHVVDVARNGFSGEIPAGLATIGLKTFLANDNRFSGAVPDFDLRVFDKFSVANNSLTGPIPRNVGKFRDARFFLPNAAGICGQPVLAACQRSAPSPQPDSDFDAAPPPSTGSNSTGERRSKKTKVLMYLGYALLGAVILALVTYLCVKKRRSKLRRKLFKRGGGRRVSDSSRVTTTTATTSVISASKSVYSIPTSVVQSPAAAAATGPAAAAPSPSLVVLRRSGTAASITSAAAAAAAKELRFEDLLKSPAELLGRGRFGSSYKVVVPGGAELAVKRVKDGVVGEAEFRRRMERVGRARHAAVLPPLAFYCAMQEKLVVYEFQTNGSLARLLHGKQCSPCPATFRALVSAPAP
ncbi:hypothetical protein PR202_ga15978 [Eleusine coracana subsp. coracana]|uniref:Protein kinase domain-containing protein n=1 Tax=Eleusine coracana subsp. coracana TaxID=191504 RepID=A0AAV5CL07_ELECO|nr:hypothetical protein PR202_ga15978 [Eleusine coracana subsp. coracana]